MVLAKGAGAAVMVCEQVAMALRGERPTELANPDVWERRRVN